MVHEKSVEGPNPGITELGFDAFQKAFAAAIEKLGNRVRFQPEVFGNALNAFALEIAPFDDSPLPLGKFFETSLQETLSAIEGRFFFLRPNCESFHQLIGKGDLLAFPPLLFALLQDLVACDLKRPGPEVCSRRKGIGLTPQDAVRVLKNVIDFPTRPDESPYKTEKPSLMSGQELLKGVRIERIVCGQIQSVSGDNGKFPQSYGKRRI